MSSKAYYKVVGKVVLVANNPRKPFAEKYDLTNYTVQLSQGDSKKFYQYPINDELQLKSVRFIAETVDERARWFKAIQAITKRTTMPVFNRESSALIPMPQNLSAVAPQFVDSQIAEERKEPTPTEQCLIGGKPVNMSTLTDIAAFLSD